MLKIQQIFPELYRCPLYVVFHNLEPQNAGLVDVKKVFVSPAKQKRDICTAFPALSSSAAAAA